MADKTADTRIGQFLQTVAKFQLSAETSISRVVDVTGDKKEIDFVGQSQIHQIIKGPESGILDQRGNRAICLAQPNKGTVQV
jgi:hypothetical protein